MSEKSSVFWCQPRLFIFWTGCWRWIRANGSTPGRRWSVIGSRVWILPPSPLKMSFLNIRIVTNCGSRKGNNKLLLLYCQAPIEIENLNDTTYFWWIILWCKMVKNLFQLQKKETEELLIYFIFSKFCNEPKNVSRHCIVDCGVHYKGGEALQASVPWKTTNLHFRIILYSQIWAKR